MRKQPQEDGDEVGTTLLTAIRKIVIDNPKPRIDGYYNVEGNMTFSVAVADLGYTQKNLAALRKLLSTRFYADFVAELILRRNVHQFMDRVAEEKYYEMDARLATHEHFGVTMDEGRVFFMFHPSRLAEVANEEICEMLKCPIQNRS